MHAVILAGGLGTRLKPFTEIIPKPLLPIGEKSLLERQIIALKDAGFTTVHLATNYKSELVESYLGNGDKFGIVIHYSKEDKPLGSCGPISLLKDHLGPEPFLVMNGDILTNTNLGDVMKFGAKRDVALTVATKIISTPFRFGNVEVEDDFLIGVEEKPEFNFEVLAGIYVMTPEIFHDIPFNQHYGMDQLIQKMLAESKPISRYLIRDYWLDIGQVEDYSKAREEFSQVFDK